MRIGVSGASGKMGSATVKELAQRAQGHDIVAISRTPGTAATPGVESRVGDYDRPESLTHAYKGLDRLLLIPTSDLRPGRRARQTIAAIDAAVAAGVDHVVLFSAAGARNVPEPDLSASYFASEQHLMRSARHWTVLRMSYYAESFAQEAQISLAYGVITGIAENKVSFVSRDDLAAAAAGLLTSEGHDGAIYTGTGPVRVTGAERAAAVARASGRSVAFIALPADRLRAQLAQAGLPPEVVTAIVGIQESFVAGSFDIVTGDIEKLAGKPPRPLDEVLRAAFAG